MTTTEQATTDLQRAMMVLNAFSDILAGVPGTKKDHQMRDNSIDFLKRYINDLEERLNTSDNKED